LVITLNNSESINNNDIEILKSTNDNPSPFPILYLNDIDLDYSSFKTASSLLASEYMVLLHNPYKDLSINTNESIDFNVISRRIVDILDEHNISSIHIIAHGFSSILANNFSINYPDYVKSMIYEDFSTEFNVNNRIYNIDYSKIACPTLLLRGSKSDMMLPQQNQDIVMSNDLLRSSSIENVEKDGHFHNVESYISQVTKFISFYS